MQKQDLQDLIYTEPLDLDVRPEADEDLEELRAWSFDFRLKVGGQLLFLVRSEMDEVLIGRGSNNNLVAGQGNRRISRQHCRLIRVDVDSEESRVWLLEDTSRNGTIFWNVGKVKNVPFIQAASLRGDRIKKYWEFQGEVTEVKKPDPPVVTPGCNIILAGNLVCSADADPGLLAIGSLGVEGGLRIEVR